MGVLLGFAPFLAFAVTAGVWGPTVGLIVSAAFAAALLARDIVRRIHPDTPPGIAKIAPGGRCARLQLYQRGHKCAGNRVRICIDSVATTPLHVWPNRVRLQFAMTPMQCGVGYETDVDCALHSDSNRPASTSDRPTTLA